MDLNKIESDMDKIIEMAFAAADDDVPMDKKQATIAICRTVIEASAQKINGGELEFKKFIAEQKLNDLPVIEQSRKLALISSKK